MSKKSHKADVTILTILGVITVLAILGLVGVGWLRGGQGEEQYSRTTQSANVEGTVVAYTLFQRLGYTVARSDRPFVDKALDGTDVLLVLDPLIRVNGAEVSTLDEWVRHGGVLVCSEDVSLQLLGVRVEVPPIHVPTLGGATTRIVPKDAAGLPLARGVDEVGFAGEGHLALTSAGHGLPEDAERLFADEAGLRIAGVRMDKGELVVLSDSSFLANGSIGMADNAVLATNLLAYALSVAPGRHVSFDEYHLGYGTHESGWSAMAAMLLHTRPGWAVLSLAIAGLLYLVYKGRRFGPRRGLERSRRRSKLEYVNAVGATYRAAGAHGLVLGILLTRFRGDAAALVGLPASAGFDVVAGRLAKRTGRPAERYESVVRECEAALEGRSSPSARRMSALLAKLAQIELEMRNERRTGN